MHRCLRISEVGINRFEAFVSAQGLSVKRYKSFIKTTRAGKNIYPNLVNGIEIDDINQLWSSDLTYFITPSITLYIVFIIDVYSRRIIGYSASDNMLAVSTLDALKMALKLRGQRRFDNLIHHSDKGSQYGSNAYVDMLLDATIKISMANNCFENPYSERINGIIKNDYLVAYYIATLVDLVKALPKAIKCYNNYPHGNLIGEQSPIEFEENLRLNPDQNKQVMKLYNFEK
jgi:putative transposase